MSSFSIRLLLADDDLDDCLFFEEALQDLSCKVHLSTVHDGEQLMNYLEKAVHALPSIVFLDLNMPRKNGFECLSEIKSHTDLKTLPVIVYSTSLDTRAAETLYAQGAQHYIRKPAEFSKLKLIIEKALHLTVQANFTQPVKEQFIIQI